MANEDPLLNRFWRKRRTWVTFFVFIYFLLFFFSWNLLRSVFFWYKSAPVKSAWSCLGASVLFGAIFGVLSVAAVTAVFVPATVLTWITVLVLLFFAGKPREILVFEGRKITRDIAGFAVIALSCAFETSGR